MSVSLAMAFGAVRPATAVRASAPTTFPPVPTEPRIVYPPVPTAPPGYVPPSTTAPTTTRPAVRTTVRPTVPPTVRGTTKRAAAPTTTTKPGTTRTTTTTAPVGGPAGADPTAAVSGAPVASAPVPAPRAAESGSGAVRLAVPAYVHADDLRAWELLAARADVVGAVVINPRSGPDVSHDPYCEGIEPPDPGSQTGPDLRGLRNDDRYTPRLFGPEPALRSGDPAYLSVLAEQFRRRATLLRSRGIAVYGYVWVNANNANPACARSTRLISQEIAFYREHYGIIDIFFDDSSGSCAPADADRRAEWSRIVRAGGGRVVLNLGVEADPCVAGDADVVIDYEQSGAAYLDPALTVRLRANADALHRANPRLRVWHLIHSAPAAQLLTMLELARGRGADLFYATDDTTASHGCDAWGSAWDALPGLWPLVRRGDASCADRAVADAVGFGALADAAARTLPSTTSSLPPTSSSPRPAPTTTMRGTSAPGPPTSRRG